LEGSTPLLLQQKLETLLVSPNYEGLFQKIRSPFLDSRD